MFNISNNRIVTMNKGDSIKVPLFINAGDETELIRYILQEGDKLYFSVMEPNAPFECGVIRKILTKDDLNAYGDAVVKLGLNDTQYLQSGIYYYEAKLVKQPENTSIIGSEFDSFTVIPRTKFVIND